MKKIDVTLPGMRIARGHIHPITDILEQMLAIFESMGFEVAMTQDIEDNFHNFAALNFPPHHPARDMQDTFYVDGGMLLLRTHISNGQIRVMEKRRPPLAVVCPGRCYRRDNLSVRASPMFTQIEGFMVDQRGRITMAHLKGVLTEFVRAFFSNSRAISLQLFSIHRAEHQLDMHCLLCDGAQHRFASIPDGPRCSAAE